jgi:hypothetical protein
MNMLFLYGLVIVGMAVQFVKKMADLEAAGTLITPWQYARQKPWSASLAIMSTLILAYVFHLMGQLNELAAIFTGLYSTEAFDSLRARAVGRLGQLTGQKQTPMPQAEITP